MTIVIPEPLPTYQPEWFPLPQVTPFTFRDGQSFLERLERAIYYLNNTVIPYINDTIQDFSTEFIAEINTLIQQVNDSLTAQSADVDSKINDLTTFVNTSIATNTAYVDSNVASLTTYVDNAVASIVGSTIAVSDPVIVGVISTTSQSHEIMDQQRYASLIDGGIIPRRVMECAPLTSFTPGAKGISVATVAAGGSGYVVGDTITLTGGTFTYPAILTVASVTSGAVTSVTVLQAGIYSVSPASPTAQGSTSGAGTGATFNGTWTGRASSIPSRTFVAANTSSFKFTGNGPAEKGVGSGFYGNAVGNDTASTFEWECDSSSMTIHLGGTNMQGVLEIDGRRVSETAVTTAADGASYAYSLDFGTAKQMRRYKLFGVNMGFAGISITTGSIIRTPSRMRPFVWGLGDSYMFGNGAKNVGMASFDIMAEQLDYDYLPDGVGGAGWTGSTDGDAVTRVNAKLVPITRAPDIVVLDMGYNNSATDQTAMATSFNAAVDQIQSSFPSAKIVCFGPATPLGETPALATVKTTLQTNSVSQGITFVDVSKWVDVNNKARYTGPDNIHPTPVGHYYLGARKAEYINRILQ